jgi:hypothetical protein
MWISGSAAGISNARRSAMARKSATVHLRRGVDGFELLLGADGYMRVCEVRPGRHPSGRDT